MSSCNRCYFLRVLTFRSMIREKTDSKISLSSLNVSFRKSVTPCPFTPAFPRVTLFLSEIVLPSVNHSPCCLVFVVQLYLLGTLPPVSRLSVSFMILLYICMYISRISPSFVLKLPRLSRNRCPGPVEQCQTEKLVAIPHHSRAKDTHRN